MYVLNSISSSMRFKLGSAATTNQVTCVTAFEDRRIDAENASPGNQLASSNNTTIVSIVDAPTSGVSRTVQQITVYNADTASVDLKVYYTQSGTDYTVFAATLASGSSAYYEWKQGWTVVSSLGDLQTSGSGGGLSDGDLGDIIVSDSGAIVTLDQKAVAEGVAEAIADSPTIAWDRFSQDAEPGTILANWICPAPLVVGAAPSYNGSVVYQGTSYTITQKTYTVGHQNSTPAGDFFTHGALRFSNTNDGAYYASFKSRSGAADGHTIVQSGDYVGGFFAAASDGTDYAPVGGMFFIVDGTPGNNDMPGRIEWWTTPDGSGTYTQKMILDNAGSLTLKALGATTPVNLIIEEATDSSNRAAIQFGSTWVVGADLTGTGVRDFFWYNGATRMCLSPSGELGVGASYTSGYQLSVSAASNGASTSCSVAGTIPVLANQSAGGGYGFVTQNTSNSQTLASVQAQNYTSAGTGFGFFYGYSDLDGSSDLEFNLRGDGTGLCDGSWTGGGADYAEYFEWKDGNPNGQDRVGVVVVLDGMKVRPANAQDPVSSIIGVVSAKPAVVGDAGALKWSGQYDKDEFGRYVKEDYNVYQMDWTDTKGQARQDITIEQAAKHGITIPDGTPFVVQQRRKLSAAFDPNQTYVPREQRKEWSAIGLLGKLWVRKGQPVGDRWILMKATVGQNKPDLYLVR